MRQFPAPLLAALRDKHEDGCIAPEMAKYLADTKAAPHDPTAIANAIGKVVGADDRQLTKVMLELWRDADPRQKSIAAQCAPALIAIDLKRALRFLQKAEKKLAEPESCDRLAAAYADIAVNDPSFWIREAQNRVSSKRPLVRRLGLGLVRKIAVPGATHTEALQTLLASLSPETDEQVMPLRDELSRCLSGE